MEPETPTTPDTAGEQQAQAEQQSQAEQPGQAEPADEPKASPRAKRNTRDKSAGEPAGPQAERAPRDNRRIVSGVQLLEGGAIRTHAGTSEADHDALEERLTPDQVERLKEVGALEGDWHGRAATLVPMRGSRDERGAGQGGGSETAELRQLRAEKWRLRQQIGKGAPADEAPAANEGGGKQNKATRPRGRRPH
jgi:hypothetical protein